MSSEQEKPFWLERYRSSIFFFLIVLSLAGIYASQKVPISVFPETNFPRVVIGVDNGVMPVEQMQVTITKPIEDAMNAVPGLATVRSNTSRGSAEVSLFFDWNMDMFRTLQLVDAALSKVRQTLPATAVITTNRLTFATFPIIGYSLTSDTLSQTELWELATYTLKPPLNRVAGVSMVTVQGGKVPEFHIVPNMARLQATNVTILDIVNAVQASNIVDSPGLYEENHQLILGLVGAQAHDADQLGRLVVKATASGAAVRVSDVATVQPGVLPVYTTVTADNRAAVLMNITRQPASNTVAVADAVAAQVEQLKKNLPAGVQMKLYYDQAELVRESIRSVRDAIMIGLLLACVILFLFLGDWSSSLVAGLVIPVTVAITVLVLWAIGQSFNLMTLGGLAAAIGLVIDDAIVVVENIVLHRDTGESRASAARLALKEISAPLVGSTITPVVVFLPLVSVTGVTGSFFRALAITMTVALLTSLLLAVTWTPALSLALLRDRKNGQEEKRHEEHHGKLMTRVIAAHHRVLTWSLARPAMLLAICGLLVVGTYAGYRALGSDLLPEMDEGGFILDYIMPAGSSLTETNRVLEHVNRILHSMPEVESTSRRTGLQMGLAAVTEANTGDMTVKLKKNRDRGIDEVIADARAQIKKAEPELDVEFIQVLQDMINDLSNAPEPIQIKLFCDNFAVLDDVAPRVGDAISKIPGVVSVENGIENTISGSGTNFQVDPVVAARLGFTPQEVAEDATSILDGVNTTDPLIANGRPYTIRVRLGDETRRSLDTMQNTVFNSATGKLATLGSLAQVTQLPPQNQIRRENLQRLVVVTAQLEGTDLGSAIARVRETVDAMHLPSSVRIEYGGTYQEQQQSFHQLLQVLLLSLALVFGVLLMEFRNLYAPIAILTSSVLSISGVVLALLVTKTTFNVASFMGLIMVIGIVAKNGILLLDADERYRREGGSPYDAMLHAAQRRLRPILMTATAAICGMLPLAFALGSGSQMLQPLAISVIGGLVISMLLSLIVTPVVYYLLTAHRHEEAAQA
ncbi:efflux RND transporter permease subunit [Terriglobus albidus]|uniref:efflux RND transporter permease subunit n=1 Tax=Terriglobus albidus TaxID=1592106 RepID=UPI0021DFB38B|nr:efflux RND transporter permease subunit [Terriglobus albidus]